MADVEIKQTSIATKQWNGKTLTFREDGYFNMTKAAKQFGKDQREFFKLKSTDEYINELEQVLRGIPLISSTRGRYGGTWAHPKLAVFFARWLDVRFAVACDARHQSIRFL